VAVTVKNTIFLDVTPYNLIEVANILGECTASFRLEELTKQAASRVVWLNLQPQRWRQCIPLKCR
jgi:hypothetical protein